MPALLAAFGRQQQPDAALLRFDAALGRMQAGVQALSTMARNPLRVTLTAFSIAWGIFMLVILMGVVKSWRNGTEANFAGDAQNSLWVNVGTTSMAYRGYKPDRDITMENSDLPWLLSTANDIENGSARNNYGGLAPTITYGKRSSSFDLIGVTPGYRYLENLTMTHGRFINETDIAEKKKVAVLGNLAYAQLFEPGEDAVGKFISVNGIMYKVVGVFTDPGGERDMQRMYVPITTTQYLYNKPNKLDQIILLINTDDYEASKAIEQNVKELLMNKYAIHPEDERAVRFYNNLKDVSQVKTIFTYLNIFMWFVGVMTILIGIIGVGNIMIITVKERTREIGIRMALGATPYSIVSMILSEALLMTVFAGYLGLLAGIGLIELVASQMADATTDQHGQSNSFMGKPEVDLEVAVIATVILIVAGVLAGLIPAIRAARVNPITAIKDV
jgi:putative ABC transport system permease protein